MAQFASFPEMYLNLIRAELPDYDRFQEAVAASTLGMTPRRVLELGTGTGETSRHVLDAHPDASLVGIDQSEGMLTQARRVLDAARTTLVRQRLEDPLPDGPFDLVISALAVHHLTGPEKADLFSRVRAALTDAGRFVLADVIVPEDPADAVTPLNPAEDRPDSLADQLTWLGAAGFTAVVTWQRRDLVVIASTTRPAQSPASSPLGTVSLRATR